MLLTLAVGANVPVGSVGKGGMNLMAFADYSEGIRIYYDDRGEAPGAALNEGRNR